MVGKGICTYSEIPSEALPWFLKYSKNPDKNHKDLDEGTNLFIDHDPAWNGMANWDFECVDWIHEAQNIAKIFSWIVFCLITVPSMISIPALKVLKKPELAPRFAIGTNCMGLFL